MKTNIMIHMAILSLSLLLTACGQTKEENKQSTSVKEEVKTEEAVTENVEENVNEEEEVKETPAETPENSNAADEGEYTLTKEVHTENNITIYYPQISGLADEAKQTEINQLLFDEAYKVMNFYPETEGLEMDIDYTISFQHPSFLSVQYAGIGFVKGTAHPNNMFYTTNIDVKNAKRIQLTDVVIPNEKFVGLFKSDAFHAVTPELGEIAGDLKANVMTSDFENADSLDSIGTEKHSETFTYFTEDAFGISIAASHAVGGHAAFEIYYRDLPAELRVENDVWELFHSQQ